MKLNLREAILVGGVVVVSVGLTWAVVIDFQSPALPVTPIAVVPQSPASTNQGAHTEFVGQSDISFSTIAAPSEVWQGTVQWSDIADLAKRVDMKQDLDKVTASQLGLDSAERDKWASATEHAKVLMTGMCDCDQVNYLNHFIQCGQYAVKGNPKLLDALTELQTLKMEN